MTSATAVSDTPHASARSANGQSDVTALERRINELEQLATSQSRELRIQF